MTDIKLASIRELSEELMTRVRCGVLVINWIDEGQKEEGANAAIRRFKGYNHEILGLLSEMELILKNKVIVDIMTSSIISDGESADENPLS